MRYLEALEADDLVSLPQPTFTRGFIRAYCQVLQSPADEALLLYHRQTGIPPPVAIPAGGEHRLDLQARSRSTVLVSFVLVVVLGIALVAVTLVLQPGRETGGGSLAPVAVEPSAAPQPVPELDAPRSAGPVPELRPPQAAAAAPPGPAPAAPEITAHAGPVAAYRLIARVSEPTWVRVRMDDGRATEETIPAGEVREWVSKTPFVLTVGNAGGITLELNGRPLPPLGARGAVISRLVVPSPPQ